MEEAVGWTGIVIAVAAMIRGEVSAYTARKAARDKLEFDAERVLLREQCDVLSKQNVTQAAQLTTQATQIATLTRDHDECKRLSLITEARLEQIEKSLAQKKDRTDGHAPLRTDPD